MNKSFTILYRVLTTLKENTFKKIVGKEENVSEFFCDVEILSIRTNKKK